MEMQDILVKAKEWTSSIFDEDTITETSALIEKGGDDLKDAFYKDLEFGTGGLRGIMGSGTNRINKYTIGAATQGLSNFINQAVKKELKSVAIACDSRNNSQYFAQISAEILSANGIKAYLFEALRPTPELSFAVRELGCDAGIVITASHNPKEYNGYKVYWNDGGQLIPPFDTLIIDEVRKVTFDNINWKKDASLIQIIGEDIDEKYINTLVDNTIHPEVIATSDVKIVYTSLHGTGVTIIPKLFKQAGFKQVFEVEEQSVPNGDFPTVESPNPEESSALAKAILLAEKKDADVLLGTDPDTDRVGIAIKNKGGKIELLNGNQTAVMLTHYVLSQLKAKGNLPTNGFVCKTIVTTQLIEKIASSFNVETINTLTGFKWIAEQIRLNEGEKQYLFGGEESYGYLFGDKVRDKDAAASALLICEMIAWVKSINKTPYQYLVSIYEEFGLFQEKLVSVVKKGFDGAQQIKQMMLDFRENPPKEIEGLKVVSIADYQSSKVLNILTNETKQINLPKSNVLQVVLEDETMITVRPSGTEPKIKFYGSGKERLISVDDFDTISENITNKLEKIISSLAD